MKAQHIKTRKEVAKVMLAGKFIALSYFKR